MMILVIGGSGSGKSSYAEDIIVSKFPGMKKYYLATMQAYDEEGQRRVKRHRELRKGKGFLTIEQPLNIQTALEKMEPGNRAVLLECISNLTANEMFAQEESKAGEQVADEIVSGIELLKENVTNLVVVSNNVFEDGIVYDETTMDYIHAMGEINQRLAMLSDHVVEVVVGIPVEIK